MTALAVTIQATLKPDGTLILDELPGIAPGRVQVTVQPVLELPDGDLFWQRMQAVWKGRAEAGCVPRSVEEVEAERRETRNDWDERSVRLEGDQYPS